MDTCGLLMLTLCCFLQLCVTESRPESSAVAESSRMVRRSIDQMVFPDSGEDERAASGRLMASMQMRRPLSPTPAPTSDCRQIKVVRLENGTLGHRYVECNNATNMQIPTRINTEEEDGQRQGGTVTRIQGPTSNDNPRAGDHIVFPGGDTMEPHREPECANGQRFCTEDSSYPISQIEQLLQRVGNLNDLLQSDVEDDTLVAQRVDVPGEETFCDYDSRMEYPKKALSRDEKWLNIVNHSNYTQGIRMEICRNIDRPCKMSEIFPYSIKTKCVQKYQYRQLLALGEDGQLRREYFSMPTCCLCTFWKM